MDTLFTDLGEGRWQPQDYARGPFDGLQGGGLAALMCSGAEAQYQAGLKTVAIEAHLLRPAPLAVLELAVRPVQVGGRLVVFHVDLASEGKLRATATVTAMRAATIAGLPGLVEAAHSPETGALRPAPSVHGKPWLMHHMEPRQDANGVPWFGFDLPVTGRESIFARALCPADWLPGLTRADSWEKPLVAAAPNVDLSVRAFREPVGRWTGVRAAGRWSGDGIGAAQGELFDTRGVFGFASCTVALVPRT